MTDRAPSEAPKQRLAAVFDDLAATYDQLRFLQVAAHRLLELVPLTAGARVLDVATGTGVLALAAARRAGPTGAVLGVDLAPEMLVHAREKLAHAGLENVEFRQGDAEHLTYPDQRFDVVLCGSALPFMPDMRAAVREFHRVLAPGGVAAFSSFGPAFLQPLRDLWAARLRRYGLTAAPLPVERLGDPDICAALLREAGFTAIEAHGEQLGYYLPNAEARWADITAGLEGKPLLHLPPEQREQVKAEHLAELAAVTTAEGIWLDVPAIFAVGRRATDV